MPNEILEEVIVVYPEILLKAFTYCLREEEFFDECMMQRLALFRKGEKPLEDATSYKPICFQKGRSTVDAIQAMVDIATKARKGTSKGKGFCALTSIDIRNAFNTPRWKNCIGKMIQKKARDYLLWMIDDDLRNRWVIYEGEKWSLKEKMTCGAHQGSRVVPLVWNVMYDDFLRINLLVRMSIIGFTDDALVVCTTDEVGILKLRINGSLW